MAIQRNSSLDLGYTSGDLSLFPVARDDINQLYETRNNAVTTLKQSLTYNGKYIIVDDNSAFPDKGLLTIGPQPGQRGGGPYEIVYYDTKNPGIFRNLIRGFAGSRQNQWPSGAWVSNSVMAEHHNAIKDAILQIESDIGISDLPLETSLNGILRSQEVRFLNPKPLFRAHPIKGPAPLRVRFQNFSTGPLIRYLWDFGDGTTSVEKSPIHTYQQDGLYSVKLNILTSLGAQGITIKNNYITVSDQERIPFFYVTPLVGYSRQTAIGMGIQPTTFNFVDQTDGEITQRYWVFDGPGRHDGVQVDSESIAVTDPNNHSTTYVYDLPGEYNPTLLVVLSNQNLKRAFLQGSIVVQ
jgi:hypothetical protein